MKTNEIAKLTVKELKALAKSEELTVPSKAKRNDLVTLVTSHFTPPAVEVGEDEKKAAKDSAIAKAKASKKATVAKGKLALVYDSLDSLRESGTKVKGIDYRFWKASKTSADYSGLTIRFTGEVGGGFDSALVKIIRKSLFDAGLTLSTMTIRKTGSACLWVK